MTGHRREFADALVAELPVLRRYAIGLTGNQTLADDLVQDSIERALRQSSQLRDLARIRAWLRRILYNAYIDDYRRARSKGKEEDIASLADSEVPRMPAQERESVADLAKAMDGLTPEHREILLLVSVEELNYRQIAEELGIPIGTVMSRLARARDNLHAILQGDEAGVLPFPRLKAKP